MRLIDADALKATFEKQRRYAREDVMWCIDRDVENIDAQSTAYDIDEVVEELKKQAIYVNIEVNAKFVELNDAIEIVKGDGK